MANDFHQSQLQSFKMLSLSEAATFSESLAKGKQFRAQQNCPLPYLLLMRNVEVLHMCACESQHGRQMCGMIILPCLDEDYPNPKINLIILYSVALSSKDLKAVLKQQLINLHIPPARCAHVSRRAVLHVNYKQHHGAAVRQHSLLLPMPVYSPAACLHIAQFIDDGNKHWEITHHKTHMWQSQKAGHSVFGCNTN